MAIKRRIKDRDTELQMAPMIDCVFLLLIFFMVTAVMKVEPNFTITLPRSDTQHEFPRKKYNVFVGQNDEIAVAIFQSYLTMLTKSTGFWKTFKG